MKRLLILLAATALCGFVQAKTSRTWKGGAVGAYETAANWDPEGVPEAHDTLVFDHTSGHVLVTFAEAPSTWDGLEFKGGTTAFGFPSGVNKANISFYSPGTITVAPGATAIISNRVCAASQGLQLTITGGGDLILYSDQVDNVGYFDFIDIKAGSVSYHGGGGQPNVGPAWQVRKTYVRSGAELHLYGGCLSRGYYGYHQYPSFDVEAGGLLTGYWASGSIGGISGNGTVQSTGGTFTLDVYHDQGPTTFGGTTSGLIKLTYKTENPTDNERVTLASENAFAGVEVVNRDAIRFSSASSVYRIRLLGGTPGADGFLLEDTAGNPIALHAKIANPIPFAVTGNGDLYLTEGTTVTGAVIRSTGQLGLTGSGLTYAFGDGLSTANDANLSTLTNILVTGATARFNQVGTDPVATPVTGTSATLELKNNAELTAVDVAGTIRLYEGARVTRPKLAGNVEVYGDSEIEGSGRSGLGIILFNDTAKTLELVGGSVYRKTKAKNNDAISLLPLTYGSYFSDATGGNLFRMTAGTFRYSAPGGLYSPNVEVKGGLFSMDTQFQPGAVATASDPVRFLLDGGTLELKDDNSASSKKFTAFPDNEAIQLEIGANGGRIRSETFHYFDYGEYFFKFARPLVPAAGVADGGVTVYGAGSWQFAKPLSITGGFAMLDGRLKVDVADLAATSAWFGTGDFIAGNTYVDLSGVTAGKTLELATGEDSELVIRGAPFFQFGDTAAQMAVAKHVTARAIRVEKGGVLSLGDHTLAGLFDGSGSTFKVTEGVALNADTGLVKIPAVVYANNANRTVHLTYDATKGFTPFANYVEDDAWDLTTSTAATVPFLTADGKYKIVGKNKTSKIGALKLNGTYVQVNANARLEVGNGTDPAVIIFDNLSALVGQGTGEARGTVDFRGSLGVFTGQTSTSAGNPNGNRIGCRLAGTGGIAFASSGKLQNRFFSLDCANVHSGGTYVNSCRVTAASAGCFGSGDVYVGAGERTGGRVKFAVAETYANSFHVGGHGIWDSAYNNANGGGALYFEAGATLSGGVELVEDAEICVTNGVTATFAGAVSGKRLVLYNGFGNGMKSDCSGRLVLSAANTYAGGTEIDRATLCLAEGGTLGSGEVLLDGGTLAFANSGELSLPNRIAGKGTVRLEGRGTVTLAGGLDTDDFGGLVSDNFTLALGNRAHFTVPTLDGFSSITTDRAAPIDLYVLDGKAFAGTVPANVTLHAGPRPKLGTVILLR